MQVVLKQADATLGDDGSSGVAATPLQSSSTHARGDKMHSTSRSNHFSGSAAAMQRHPCIELKLAQLHKTMCRDGSNSCNTALLLNNTNKCTSPQRP
jgi:hypothetical protein